MNYQWAKANIMTNVRFIINSKIKKGYSLFANLTDYYFTNEIKIASVITGKIIILVFYHISVDFYFIAPFIQNLIGTMKYVCNAKELTANKIKKKIVDVNTMLIDTIGLFNCFTRVINEDFDAYLGSNAIFNQMCFVQMKNVDKDLGDLIRYFLTRQFHKRKKENTNENSNDNTSIPVPKVFKGVYQFNKAMKNARTKKYIGKIIQEDNNETPQDNINIERYMTYNNRYYNNENIIQKKKEVMEYTNKKTQPINIKTFNTTTGTKTNTVNLLDLSLYKDNSNDNKNTNDIGNYPIIEPMKKEEDDKLDIFLDSETIANINKNISFVNSINTAIENSKLNKSSNDIEESKTSNDFNSIFIPSKSPLPSQSIYNTINPNNNHLDLSSVDFTKGYEYKKNKSVHYHQYNRSSLNINNNNPYPDLSNQFKTTSVPIVNTNKAQMNLSTFNSYNNQSRNAGMVMYPNNNINNNNNKYNQSMINQYKYQTNKLPMSVNSNITLPSSSFYTNSHSHFDNAKFSQEDMSFLNGTSQTVKKEHAEDYLNINRYNPEIFAELKEKLFFYYNSNKQIRKIDSKGYIGISMKKGFKINRKTFFLMILQPSWKDELTFTQKEIDNKLMYKITETNYHVDIINKSSNIKLLTYILNNNSYINNILLNTSFAYLNNVLFLTFKYNIMLLKRENIYKMTISLIPQTPNTNINISALNGKVTKTNNNEYMITYLTTVDESKITFDTMIPLQKIIIRMEMKNSIVSNNEIRMSYNNSVSSQENLTVYKMALLSYEYDMI